MRTYQKTLISILIGLIAFPVITLGSSFTVSLVQGKTVEEAVQILANQIDLLIGRVETLETKQEIYEQSMQEMQMDLKKEQAKQEAYKEFRIVFDRVWLYGKNKGEETTIQDTREYCQRAIEDKNEGAVDNFCPLADELERTWDAYQSFLE